MSHQGYYSREKILYLDGTNVFQTSEDRQSEREIAGLIERKWNCVVHSFGALSPLDWWAERDGRLVGVLELKTRSHCLGTYPTVFLNVRKWLSLTLASVGLGCPAIYVVRFSDLVCWCNVSGIDTRHRKVGGCKQIVKSENDREVVIEIPVSTLKNL